MDTTIMIYIISGFLLVVVGIAGWFIYFYVKNYLPLKDDLAQIKKDLESTTTKIDDQTPQGVADVTSDRKFGLTIDNQGVHTANPNLQVNTDNRLYLKTGLQFNDENGKDVGKLPYQLDSFLFNTLPSSIVTSYLAHDEGGTSNITIDIFNCSIVIWKNASGYMVYLTGRFTFDTGSSSDYPIWDLSNYLPINPGRNIVTHFTYTALTEDTVESASLESYTSVVAFIASGTKLLRIGQISEFTQTFEISSTYVTYFQSSFELLL